MTPEEPFPPETPAPADPAPPYDEPTDGETPPEGAAAEPLPTLGGDDDASLGEGLGGPSPDDPESAEQPLPGGSEDGARPEPDDLRDGPAAFGRTISVRKAQGQNVHVGDAYYGDVRPRAPERLGVKHCEAFEPGPLARRLRGMEWSLETLRSLEEHAQRSRFLILSGETGLGKGSLALTLAATLLQHRPGPKRVLLTGRPSPDLQVDLRRLAIEVPQSVLVVEDAFVHANPSLRRLVEELDGQRLRSLDDSLRGAGCWVLLTASPESVPGDPARLDGVGVHLSLAAPRLDELRGSLHRLAQLRLSGDGCREDDRDAVKRLLEATADAICERLRTLPRLAAFVDGYLLTVARNEMEWEAAADRVDGLAEWLFEELPSEPTAWSFALALTLACAVPALGDPPLLAFDPLWRRLDAAMREGLAGETPPPRPLAALGVGESLLRRTRSEIAGSRLPAVRFRDPETPLRLWRALVDGPGRQVAGLLMGWLRPMVADDDPRLRETAARALGRLGALDPFHSTLPLVERWVGEGDPRCFDGTLGGLLQGVVSAGDDDYRRATLRQLSAAGDRSKTASWIARAAGLRDLGEVDLRLAMSEIRRAFEGQAKSLVDPLWQAHREAQRRLEAIARGGRQVSEGVRQRVFSEAMTKHVPKLANNAFRAYRYALIGLGLLRDPVDVLHHIRPWLTPEPEETADRTTALAGATALVLLSERGVLHLWGVRPIAVPISDDEDFAFSRLLLAVAGDEGAAKRAAEVLAAALDACSHLPPPLASVLRVNWRSFLIGWGNAVGRCDTFDEAYAELLRRLLPLSAGHAGDEVFRLLQGEPCFRGEDGKPSRFAAEVLAG